MNTPNNAHKPDDNDKPTLLLVDDDETCRSAMGRAFERRGYEVASAGSVPAALQVLTSFVPEFAVVDLRMPGPSGLSLVRRLREVDPNTRIVMLTGYASVATAVEAIKLGAIDYLIKPVNVDDVESALTSGMDGPPKAKNGGNDATAVISVDRLAWEHIQRTLTQNGGNVSATARALGMHRRTLQRKLIKHPARR